MSVDVERKVRGQMAINILLLVLAVPIAVLVSLQFFGLDGNRYTAALLALTPYAAAAGIVLGVVALVLRRWWIGGGVLLLALALVAVVLPRVLPDRQPDSAGPVLRVLSSNQYFGRADAQRLVELVRANDIDVLALLELNSAQLHELADAGLFTLLPNRVQRSVEEGVGSALLSRHPLDELPPAGPSTFAQPAAVLRLPDGGSVDVVAVHPRPPVSDMDDWRRDLAVLPTAAEDRVRILAGDFNATLDHAAFRRLLSSGYHDAAEQRGKGLVPTWPSGLYPPPVTIDHVLADKRVAVRDYRVFDMPGADHDAVYAELALPG